MDEISFTGSSKLSSVTVCISSILTPLNRSNDMCILPGSIKQGNLPTIKPSLYVIVSYNDT